ncbi:hypothetical protein AAFF_G00212970 [Aldrovandia affinis]|uniref:Partitioning defective 3 homolog B-like n=1 Tax=Aldrovandia affinis TaxID=143900 RepID=A0AAD7RGV2_9TELE|nr:hypothetical protein AAFF_G00212970 [Aldrovandia affinis]
METLRRSMSMEGNLRGMIQLVLVRPLDRFGQENQEPLAPQSRPMDQSPPTSMANSPALPAMMANSIYERSAAPETVPNGRYDHMDVEEDEEEFPLAPALPPQAANDPGPGPQRTHTQSPTPEPGPYPFEPVHPDIQQPRQVEYHHVKSSKSMDLVADESNVGSLAVHKSESPEGRELGPTLGLKKSSSLESLQTAMSEVRKSEPPFHRPRLHMVRGRGCNESFRAAIDKSYDGPPDDDDLSDPSSGRDTPASGSSRQGLGDAEESKKDKKKKAKGKKKEKKSKGKEKDKKKVEEGEEQDKKTKRKGFGLLRFGKKKEDKAKAALQKQKSEVLSEEELDRMKEERERIEAKHQELRDRERLPLPDVEDDDHDPNYARINNFREPPPPAPYPHRDRSPSPQPPGPAPSHSREPSAEGPIEGLYAKVNKQRPPPMPAADSSDRIQLLRREYQQARREGAAPSYEELEARRQAQEYDPHRMAVRGHDGRMAPRYEDVERQYASLPRRGPMDPNDYPMQPWGGHREPAHYPAPPQQPGYPSYPSRDNYPHGPDRRQGDPGYYPPPPQHRGPLRQDVPPSPPLPLRAPRYDTMGGGGYRSASPDQYAYGDGRNPDPRQTAAV